MSSDQVSFRLFAQLFPYEVIEKALQEIMLQVKLKIKLELVN